MESLAELVMAALACAPRNNPDALQHLELALFDGEPESGGKKTGAALVERSHLNWRATGNPYDDVRPTPERIRNRRRFTVKSVSGPAIYAGVCTPGGPVLLWWKLKRAARRGESYLFYPNEIDITIGLD